MLAVDLISNKLNFLMFSMMLYARGIDWNANDVKGLGPRKRRVPEAGRLALLSSFLIFFSSSLSSMESDASETGSSYPFSASFPPVDLNHPAIQRIRLHKQKYVPSESAQSWMNQFESTIHSDKDEFHEIFVGDNRHFHVFDDFNIALSFGRRVARRLGFAVRIKTSSHNMTNGTTFK